MNWFVSNLLWLKMYLGDLFFFCFSTRFSLEKKGFFSSYKCLYNVITLVMEKICFL